MNRLVLVILLNGDNGEIAKNRLKGRFQSEIFELFGVYSSDAGFFICVVY